MKPIKSINAVLIAPFFMLILLSLPVMAHADQPYDSKHSVSAPKTNAHQGQAIHHEEKVNYVRSQKPLEAIPTVNHNQPKQNYQPSPQTWSYKETNRNQWMNRDHDRTHEFNQVINYVNVVTVQGSTDGNADSSAFGNFVDSLPSDYLSVYIDGVMYAYYQGVFYQQTASGYEVIDPTTLVPEGAFSISLPNSEGAYTQIQLNMVGNGFIGPQGEFYPQFPPIQQLQAMYVR